ncbi:hypothetical protein SORBI_3002G193200 [Sorghum bicolor]|uniref:Uncharacterized protein n=1 Tax=Sorghum bicolor TaxID=4558 RepID=A0A1B6QCC0_SORBI|nr:hypothetical protein SORBI_3002G193200 [Sorghum bicolor]
MGLSLVWSIGGNRRSSPSMATRVTRVLSSSGSHGGAASERRGALSLPHAVCSHSQTSSHPQNRKQRNIPLLPLLNPTSKSRNQIMHVTPPRSSF